MLILFQYCGGATNDHRLEVEHIISRANGGSNKVTNLTIACHNCNKNKDNLNLDQWLEVLKKSNKEIDKIRVDCITKFLNGNPLVRKNYGAWVNSYKNRLVEDLKQLSFRSIELSDGATTQFNRIQHGLSKQHYNDAICVGNIPSEFKDYTTVAHVITAKGRGTRLKGKVNC